MQSVLITGATGSFGKAFVKRLLTSEDHKPHRIALYSRGEHAQEEMAREISDDRLRFFIGDIRDEARLELAMRGVDTVIHAAALKIVPTAEYNPTECIATNIGGAENVVKATIRTGVKKVIALSTDKAVNPINLYGASKLAAEKIFIAANALAAGQCSYSVVRYGNVVGSRGSVVPLFKKIAGECRPIPITDERMSRFWITMDQAIDLVMKASIMSGRRIVVPKIPSMRVIDLADAIDPGGERVIVGIRPGEKLHETLLTEDEARFTSEYDDIYVIDPMDVSPSYPVKDGFRYSSDTNTTWLSVDDLRRMM